MSTSPVTPSGNEDALSPPKSPESPQLGSGAPVQQFLSRDENASAMLLFEVAQLNADYTLRRLRGTREATSAHMLPFPSRPGPLPLLQHHERGRRDLAVREAVSVVCGSPPVSENLMPVNESVPGIPRTVDGSTSLEPSSPAVVRSSSQTPPLPYNRRRPPPPESPPKQQPHIQVQTRDSSGEQPQALPPIPLDAQLAYQPQQPTFRARATSVADQSPVSPTSSPSSPPTTPSDVDRMMLLLRKQRERVAVAKSEEKSLDSDWRYRCTFEGCEKQFKQKAHLQTHMRSHTGERPFLCPFPQCGKNFSQQCNLRAHVRAHTGERPYKCKVCGKGFSQQGNMRNHTLIHYNEHPIVCRLDGCDRTFNQLGNLKAHQNSAHKEAVHALTKKLQSGNGVETMGSEEREIFDYFCQLYKNANKGVRGRGKGTKSIVGRSDDRYVSKGYASISPQASQPSPVSPLSQAPEIINSAPPAPPLAGDNTKHQEQQQQQQFFPNPASSGINHGPAQMQSQQMQQPQQMLPQQAMQTQMQMQQPSSHMVQSGIQPTWQSSVDTFGQSLSYEQYTPQTAALESSSYLYAAPSSQ